MKARALPLRLLLACIPASQAPHSGCRVVSVDPSFTADERSLIVEETNAWTNATGVCFDLRYTPVPEADVDMHRAADRQEACLAGDYADCDDLAGLWVYSKKKMWIVCEPNRPDKEKRQILCHEFGHSLGLSHYEGPELSCMPKSLENNRYEGGPIPARDGRAYERP